MAEKSAADLHSQRQPEAWLHERARLAPRLRIESSPWVRSVFEHAWAPMQALTDHLRCLPDAVWDYLLSCDGGFALIGVGESHYEPGPARIRRLAVRNVAHISVEDLADENERPLHVLGHLLDHHLGCGGAPEGPWLSDGGGLVPRWREAGARLLRLFDLGYGPDDVALSDARNYFAQSLAYYCRDRQRLNVADPQIWKWFRSTLWDDGFWRAANNRKGA